MNKRLIGPAISFCVFILLETLALIAIKEGAMGLAFFQSILATANLFLAIVRLPYGDE